MDPPDAESPNDPKWRDVQRAELVKTHAQIFETRAHLERLEHRRRLLEDVVGAFVFPVLTVPPELVSKIFLECLPANGRVQPRKFTAPLVLAQICQQWRQIALETQQLWCSIDLTFRRRRHTPGFYDIWSFSFTSDGKDDPMDAPYDGACKLLQTWFRRVSSCPLSITLRCHKERNSLPASIWPAITEFAGQWGRLEIQLPMRDIPLLERIRGPFPLLYSLSINDIHRARDTDALTHLTAFCDAPRLREVRLWDLDLDEDVQIGNASLTMLELHERLTFPDVKALLERFPNLTSLHITFWPWDEKPKPALLEGLPPLESLTVRMGELLPFLTLPHLRHLEHRIIPPRIDPFLSFISRSGCVLQSLRLDVGTLDCALLLECLAAVPSLVTFHLEQIYSSSTFYDRLWSPSIFPNLLDLSVEENGSQEDYYTSVIAMLSSRREPQRVGAQLRSFDLKLVADSTYGSDDESEGTPSGAEAAQLQRLVDDGLKLCIISQGETWPAGSRDVENEFI
ncbi:hypothetical protein FB45DRAFT_1063786 [Roridomyces roridus]|uniref:F-box domain-containing protein n=1 Tax=Roridomyces roridus TaxID=1738132 RepID=A0AAD7BD18_9AGAR|nr:hypothetical protein FB45DRAFT_1063786 [Roridomyces roridus]